MGCTLDELGQRMSGQEFGLWCAYMQHEWVGPLGDLKRWAHLAALGANGPLSREGHELWDPSEFLAPFEWAPADRQAAPPAAQPSTADLQTLASVINAGL